MSVKLGDNLTPQNGRPAKQSGFSNAPPRAPIMRGVNSRRIILEDNNDIPPTGLFIGHNGNSYMIRTGVEVDAPEPLLAILDDAVVTVPIIDTNSQRIVGSRQKQRFPYREIHHREVA